MITDRRPGFSRPSGPSIQPKANTTITAIPAASTAKALAMKVARWAEVATGPNAQTVELITSAAVIVAMMASAVGFNDHEIPSTAPTAKETAIAADAMPCSKGNDHIIDAVRCAILAREQGRLDEVWEETVSPVPLVTDPIIV